MGLWTLSVAIASCGPFLCPGSQRLLTSTLLPVAERGVLELVREFNLFPAIAVEPPRTLRLMRVTDHPTNQEFNATWLLRPAGGTRDALELDARLRVPRYIPADGMADAIAEAFVTASVGRSPSSPVRLARPSVAPARRLPGLVVSPDVVKGQRDRAAPPTWCHLGGQRR